MSSISKITDIEPQAYNIFVGMDRSQLFAFQVLEHSIRRYSSVQLNIHPLDNQRAGIPAPENLNHGARTGFSFVRFAIPSLMGYQGRALYLDADMLVFRDIQELFHWDMDNHHILIVGDTGNTRFKNFWARKRQRQCSVMLLDCEKCQWDADKIVNGLGKDYSYEELMYEFCILSDLEIATTLPFRWNSLEHLDANTGLIHYTDMQMQPWVDPINPLGYIWVNEVRSMIAQDSRVLLTLNEEIDAGYLRPSLYEEVQLSQQDGPLSQDIINVYKKLDRQRGYIKHSEIIKERQARMKTIKQKEKEMGIRELLKTLPSRESRHPIQRARYYYYLLTH